LVGVVNISMLKVLFYFAIVIFGFFYITELGPQIADARCASKWKDAGFKAGYRWFTGCVVDVDGRLIPETNVQVRPFGR
jgi:hypothetical protein